MSTTSYADLEVGLQHWDANNYAVELRFYRPDSDADVRLLRSDQTLVQIDQAQFQALATDPEAYGQALSESLFASPAVQSAFAQATSVSQALDAPLRMRLTIGAGASELHNLRWETLRQLPDGGPLLMGEGLLFSRYLSSGDWRPVKLRPEGSLRALVVIANPSNLSEYAPGGRPLAPVDVPGELARAQEGLGRIPITALASEGQATLANIIEQLRTGYDILFLVAHGALVRGEPRLWLERDDGTVEVVPGATLAAQLQELTQRPRLVVMASCQSAGTGGDSVSTDGGALAGLEPRLAEAGVPAVLAMQGNVSMRTMATFVPTFFTELGRDGQIDRAMAVARGSVRDQPDWWMPVLFTRLKSGRIWYTPGFGDGFEKWPALLRSIRRGQCTPIIGPRVNEGLLGSQRDIARNWAETYGFPMEPHERESLPQVAQYLAVNQDAHFPHEELIEYLRKDLLARYSDALPANMHTSSLDDMFAFLGAQQRAQDPADPYKVLAELPFSVYITTNLSNLLVEALRAAGKDPQIELCRWNEDVAQLHSIYDDEPDYQPDPQRPLVFYLFGSAAEPDSLVLTEDDYFDYLIGVSVNKDLIPIPVRRALSDTALLFLGFQIDDWNFRVLFRSIMSQEGRSRRKKYAHIAAQILPEEGRFLEPERARRYMESYFQDSDISIFWGSSDDFTTELQAQAHSDPDPGTIRR